MKKISIELKDLSLIEGAVLYNAKTFRPIAGVSNNSKEMKKGFLYVAIKGQNYDGHDFVQDAINNGASAVMIEDSNLGNYLDKIDKPIIVVEDTVKAFGQLAMIWRLKLSAKVISITGSNGKTTTKEIIASLLTEKGKTIKTEANNNNHIGVPKTIYSANHKHDFLVIEHGTNHFGEIFYTSVIAQPDAALITNIGNSHTEFLKSKRGVLKEKKSLFDITYKRNGKVFINTDDAYLLKELINYPSAITYGFNSDADIKGKILKYEDNGLAQIQVETSKQKFTVLCPLPGRENAINTLAAIAVGINYGLTQKQIISGLKKVNPVKQRLNIIHKKSFTIIDDTYNANPESMKSSITFLKELAGVKKSIAVLGDMFELGEQSIKYHLELLKVIKKCKINMVLLTGKMMGELYKALKNVNYPVEYFKNRESLKTFINNYELHDSVILVKGSRGMKMEEFVEIVKGRDN